MRTLYVKTGGSVSHNRCRSFLGWCFIGGCRLFLGFYWCFIGVLLVVVGLNITRGTGIAFNPDSRRSVLAKFRNEQLNTEINF